MCCNFEQTSQGDTRALEYPESPGARRKQLKYYMFHVKHDHLPRWTKRTAKSEALTPEMREAAARFFGWLSVSFSLASLLRD
jgi:hypothetical protein